MAKALQRALLRRPTNNPVTISDLLTMYTRQLGKCALSGVAMTWAGGNGQALPTAISIDRRNPRSGYTRRNVRLICFAVNAFKMNMTTDQMMRFVRGMS
jgi:hypothetical protein